MTTATVKHAVPPPAPQHPEDTQLATGLKWSFTIHGVLMAAILFKSLIFPSSSTRMVPTLRVDIVGLPDILKKDLSKIPKIPAPVETALPTSAMKDPAKTDPKTPPVKAEKADPDEMLIKPKQGGDTQDRQKKLKNSLDRIKSLAKITEIEAKKSAPIVKGNLVSKGSSLSPDARESAESSYYDLVRDRLQDNWALPVWIARQKYSAKVQLFIDAHGRLRNMVFMKPSGNPQFDEAVKKSITDSQPFPLPPDEIARTLLLDGILVGFPL